MKSLQNNLFSKMTIILAMSGQWSRSQWIYWGYATPSLAPQATATKRANNYDTWASDGTALANSNIAAAFEASDGSAITQNIMQTYIQATLRYANKMDRDIGGGAATAGWKNQGEGWGFSLVIADALTGANAATIDTMYNLSTRNTAGDNYCTAYTALSLDPIYSADLVGSLGEYASYQETTGNSGTATAPVCSSGGSSCADDPYDTNFDGMVGVDVSCCPCALWFASLRLCRGEHILRLPACSGPARGVGRLRAKQHAVLRSLVLGLFRENAGCADCANFFPICAK